AIRVADRVDEQRVALANLKVAVLSGEAKPSTVPRGTKAQCRGASGDTLGCRAQLPLMIGPSVRMDPHAGAGFETFGRAWRPGHTRAMT
ncbi:MAG: hypothetical protein LH475_02070, partial [Cryobacterium sp.]|uniref:hypothetical protein n=1 Tax=Cryobacterium sp. TaxID=1926290 RepID=UPI002291B570